MKKCIECGRQIGLLNSAGPGGQYCSKCNAIRLAGVDSPKGKAMRLKEEAISGILLTTETVPNLPIVERVEIVTAECAFGMNIFKELFAGVRDIVGGRSEAVQKTMRDARRAALYELKREAFDVGANAVVGVDLDYVELSAAGNMVMLVASGTAVILGNDGQA